MLCDGWRTCETAINWTVLCDVWRTYKAAVIRTVLRVRTRMPKTGLCCVFSRWERLSSPRLCFVMCEGCVSLPSTKLYCVICGGSVHLMLPLLYFVMCERWEHFLTQAVLCDVWRMCEAALTGHYSVMCGGSVKDM